MRSCLTFVVAAILLAGPEGTRHAQPRSAPIEPFRATAAVAHDADDPAIWVNVRDPARSLILGTDKAARVGGLYVFGLDGAVRQVVAPLDRPNNVDVERGVRLGTREMDLVVVTERNQHRLRVFGITDADPPLADIAPDGLAVLHGMTGAASEPMGIALYRRPSDGALFAFVTPKSGGTSDYVWQYRVEGDDAGGVRATLVRRFGAFSGRGPAPGEPGEIEAVVVDDGLGFVYYADERVGIRKYLADPDAPGADRELALFGMEGYEGDREGLAIYETGPTTGFILSSDQVAGGTRLHVYRREGESGHPNSHPEVAVVQTRSDATDGIEVSAATLPGRPKGMVVMMTSATKQFLMYDWREVASHHP